MPPVLLIKPPFQYYPPTYTSILQVVFLLQISPKPRMPFSSTPYVLHDPPTSFLLVSQPEYLASTNHEAHTNIIVTQSRGNKLDVTIAFTHTHRSPSLPPSLSGYPCNIYRIFFFGRFPFCVLFPQTNRCRCCSCIKVPLTGFLSRYWPSRLQRNKKCLSLPHFFTRFCYSDLTDSCWTARWLTPVCQFRVGFLSAVSSFSVRESFTLTWHRNNPTHAENRQEFVMTRPALLSFHWLALGFEHFLAHFVLPALKWSKYSIL